MPFAARPTTSRRSWTRASVMHNHGTRWSPLLMLLGRATQLRLAVMKRLSLIASNPPAMSVISQGTQECQRNETLAQKLFEKRTNRTASHVHLFSGFGDALTGDVAGLAAPETQLFTGKLLRLLTWPHRAAGHSWLSLRLAFLEVLGERRHQLRAFPAHAKRERTDGESTRTQVSSSSRPQMR